MHLALVATLLLAASCSAQLTWDPVSTSGTVPPARRDHGLGYHPAGQLLIVFGGRNMDTELDDTWIFDLANGTWSEATGSVRPTKRFSFVSGVSGDYFYVSTGEGTLNGVRTFYNDIWRFNMLTRTWEELMARSLPPFLNSASFSAANATSPETRYGATGGVYPGQHRFYVALGFDLTRYSDVFSYDLTDELWIEEYPDQHPYNPSYPHARCLHSGTMIDTASFVIFGGCLTGGKTGGACPSGDSWMFEGQSKKWERLPSCAEPRMYSSMAMLPPAQGQRRVVLYGGQTKTPQVLKTDPWPKEEIAVLNPDTKKWKLLTVSGTMFPKHRISMAMVTGANGIFMFGGFHQKGKELQNDLWLLRGSALDADSLSESRSCSPFFMNYLTVHGILMVIGWGFFLQWGAFFARYLRAKDPLWFHLHRVFQILGLLVAIPGFALGVVSVQFDHFKFAHAVIGLVVMVLGILQPLNAICRPHAPKGESKTTSRWVWEFFHHFLGRAALILALVNISLGIFLAHASTLIYSLWFAYFCLLVLCYIVAEVHRYYHKRRENRYAVPKALTMESASSKF